MTTETLSRRQNAKTRRSGSIEMRPVYRKVSKSHVIYPQEFVVFLNGLCRSSESLMAHTVSDTRKESAVIGGRLTTNSHFQSIHMTYT